jgi:outer membrane protein assembly factor BamA
MRGQIFLQAGANEERIKDVARRAAWRTSAGIGVVLPTALGMLEVNACAALVHQDTDFKTGFQFGLTPSM